MHCRCLARAWGTTFSVIVSAPDVFHSRTRVRVFARKAGQPYDDALRLFYGSQTHMLMREGVSDLHCMGDGYLSGEPKHEFRYSI